MNLPVYNLEFDENTMNGVFAISLVTDPAIEVEALQFANEIKIEEWKLANQEKRILVSPVLIPNKLIYRNNVNGGPGYVTFSEYTIEQLRDNFAKQSYQNNSTLQHDNKIQGVTFVESWIIENSTNDKSNALGYNDLPKGTWMVTAKLSQELWDNYVKTGEVKGLSVEAMLAPVLKTNNTNLNKEDNMDKDIIKKIVFETINEIKMEQEQVDIVEQVVEPIVHATVVETVEPIVELNNEAENVALKYDIPGGYYADAFDMGTIVYNMDDTVAANVEFDYENSHYKTDDTGAIIEIEPIQMDNAPATDGNQPAMDQIPAEIQAMLDEKDSKIAELEGMVQSLEAELVVKNEENYVLSNEKPASAGLKDVPTEPVKRLEDMTPLELYREQKNRFR